MFNIDLVVIALTLLLYVIAVFFVLRLRKVTTRRTIWGVVVFGVILLIIQQGVTLYSTINADHDSNLAIELSGLVVAAIIVLGLSRLHPLLQHTTQAQNKFKEGERRYRSLVESSPIAILVHSDMQIILINDEAVRLLNGRSADDFIGKPVLEVIHPDFRSTVQERISRAYTSIEPLPSIEIKLVCLDGKTVNVIATAVPITYQSEAAVQVVFQHATDHQKMAAALRVSEKRYQMMVEQSPLSTVIYSPDGRPMLTNQAFTELWGLTPEGLEAYKASYNVLKDEQLAEMDVLECIKQGFKGETCVTPTVYYDAEKTPTTKQAGMRSRWTRGVIYPIKDENGTIHEVVVLHEDMTEHMQAEAALQQSEQRYQALYNHAGDAILVHGLDGRIMDANQAACLRFGYSREELLQLNITDIDTLTHAKNTPKQLNLLQHAEHIVFTTRHKTRDGVIIPTEINSRLIDYGGQEAILSIARDITEQYQAREALRSASELLESVFNNTHLLIAYMDKDFNFIRVNDLYAQADQKSPEDFVGKNHFELYPNDENKALFRQVLQTGQPYFETAKSFEYAYTPERGVSYWDWSLHPVTGIDGEISGLILLLRDVTERLRAERAENEQRTIAEALNSTAAILNSTLDLDEVLDHILSSAEKVVPHDTASILLIEGDIARIARAHGYEKLGLADALDGVRLPLEKTANLRQMIETGEPMMIDDLHKYPGWLDPIGDTRWMRAYAGAPIRVENKVIGFLTLMSTEPDFFTPTHIEHLKALANQASIAIQNARLYEAARDRFSIAETLREAVTALNSSLELDKVLEIILQQLGEVIPYDSAAVMRYDEGMFSIVACEGFEAPDKVRELTFPVDPHFPNIHVIESKQPVAIADVREEHYAFEDEADRYESGHIRSWLGLPLIVRDRLIGMISVDRATVNPYTEEEINVAMNFANQAAIALNNAHLHQELAEHSEALKLAVEQRTAELREAKERVEAVLNNSPDATLLLKATGTIETGNPAFYTLFGYEIDEVYKQLPTKLLDSKYADQFQKAIKAVIESRSTQQFEAVATCKDGTVFDTSLALSPIQEGDALLGIVCVLRDISAFKEVERMKDDFVSNVSHELRTPITSLKLNHRLLKLNPEKSDVYVDRLGREINRLNTIIEDLLHLSRLDQDRIALTIQEVNLNTLVRQYVSDRTPIAEEKELSLSLSNLPDLPPVQADESMLGQVLSILLTNALNYTPGGGQIEVHTRTKDDGGKHWAGFSVKDSGPGLTEEDLSHVFERFFRGSAGRKSGLPGTGLGLSIANEIVSKHGGHIDAETEGLHDQGVTFSVWLPVDVQVPDDIAPAE